MTYPEVIQYLESLINYEKIPAWPYRESLKLERISGFLASIGSPQAALKCVHIAGTKGKGSTCAFLAYILREAGYKVGLYTSPHLADFRERIRILHPASSIPALPAGRQHPVSSFEGMISEDELIDLVERLMPSVEEYNRISKYGPLSFFEVYTALAFIYFNEQKTDFAVLETGLGGRFDATNIVKPLVCAITSISYEHTQKLGNTLAEIATEKAGIIKSSCQLSVVSCQPIVITAPQELEAMEVIRNRCKETGARLYEIGRDITYQETNGGFGVRGSFGEYPNLEIRLLGRHQLINATVAVGIIEALKFYNIDVDIDAIRNGLYNTIWPGRCEVIAKKPLIVLDGAQNVASARALKEAIKENFSAEGGSAKGGKYKELVLVLGISNDKDIKGICNELNDLADAVVLTRSDNTRATEPEKLTRYFNGKKTYITHSVRDAARLASNKAKSEDLILVTGSLFVVGEFRNGKI